MSSVLTPVLYKYVSSRALWSAIAAQAASFLVIGLGIKDKAVYEEAFRRVAGRFPEWPWDKPFSALPETLQAAVKEKSRTLRIRRYEIDHQLLKMTLSAKPLESLGGGPERPVDQHNSPMLYNVVNIWRDWIADHLSHIEEGNGADEPPAGPQAKRLCDHPDRDCLTLAGFYRTLSKGGDCYLPPQLVADRWNKKSFPGNEQEPSIRFGLPKLKEAAAKIGAPLVESALMYDQKDKLHYLTCVEFEEADRPWATGDDEDEDVEMED